LGQGFGNGEEHIGLKALLILALAAFGQMAFGQMAFGQTAASLAADVSFLASEELDGRETGTRDLDVAASYIATQFAKAGLKPAANGTYFQQAKRGKGWRNVAAILPGTDPVLSSQYVILSAHYDHLGHNAKGLFPGANDNASGTASVIEVAAALAGRAERPKRSILFIAFYGEEEGLLGSSYYVQHPLVPLKDTVAEINLEQLGRTDEETGKKLASFALTGTNFTNLSDVIRDAVAAVGVTIYKHKDDHLYFNRSDNYSFVSKDVVDTTIVVAFDYPDYHTTRDTVDKIDFDNLALVARGVGAAVWELAITPNPPVWTDKGHAGGK
jgi:Zn-dependent M28 family amino/carboxypeptidase